MGRIVEEERLFFLGWRGNEIGCEVAVSPFQTEEVDWLLFDDLIVHQWDSHSANIAQSKTLNIWRETSQVVTGALGIKQGDRRSKYILWKKTTNTNTMTDVYDNHLWNSVWSTKHIHWPYHGSTGSPGTCQTPAWLEETSHWPQILSATSQLQQ